MVRCLSFSVLAFISLAGSIKIPFLSEFSARFSDEMRFQKSSLEQYKDQISTRITNTVADFKKSQEELKIDYEEQLDKYTNQFNDLYSESVASLNKQKETINEINNRLQKYRKDRPKQIDESLDEFRRLFNESSIPELPQLWSPPQAKSLDSLEATSHKMEDLNTYWNNISSRWTTFSSKDRKKMIREPRNTEDFKDFMKGIMVDFEKIQEDFKLNAKTIEKKSLNYFEEALNKQDIRIEKYSIDDRLKLFDQSVSLWFEERLQSVEEIFKGLQETIILRESVFSALANKKSAKLQYTVMTDQMLSQVLRLIDQKDTAGWRLVKEEDGITVYRQFTGSKYACVKCEGVLNVSPDKILSMFEDHTRTKEYNALFAGGLDKENIAENTKIIWTASEPMYIMKARDFVSLLHVRKLKDGTMVMLQKAVEHPDLPRRGDFVRGQVLLGANIIQPVPGFPDRASVTMITQLDPGGFAPPVIINKVCTMGPVGYMRALEEAASLPPSKAVIEQKRRLTKDPKFKAFKV